MGRAAQAEKGARPKIWRPPGGWRAGGSSGAIWAGRRGSLSLSLRAVTRPTAICTPATLSFSLPPARMVDVPPVLRLLPKLFKARSWIPSVPRPALLGPRAPQLAASVPDCRPPFPVPLQRRQGPRLSPGQLPRAPPGRLPRRRRRQGQLSRACSPPSLPSDRLRARDPPRSSCGRRPRVLCLSELCACRAVRLVESRVRARRGRYRTLRGLQQADTVSAPLCSPTAPDAAVRRRPRPAPPASVGGVQGCVRPWAGPHRIQLERDQVGPFRPRRASLSPLPLAAPVPCPALTNETLRNASSRPRRFIARRACPS